MIIRHNISAQNANNRLQRNQTGFTKGIGKLSSGLRIGNAADDASGLAISEKMRAQIRGLSQAQRNIQDGISLLQTTEGALSTIDSPLLVRMRELMVQATNDTLTNDDRNKIEDEVQQLMKEINKISAHTEFNTKKLIDGSFNDVRSQVSVVQEQVEALREPLTIWPEQNDRLNFMLGGEAYSIQLDKGTYSPDSFIRHINDKLSGQSLPIHASLNDGMVVLTKKQTNAAPSNPDELQLLDPGYLTITDGLNSVPGAAQKLVGNGDGLNSFQGRTITSGVNDTLSVDVDGTTYTITITAGNYGNSQLVMDEINAQFASAGADIKMYQYLPPPWNRSETLLDSATSGVKHRFSNISGNAYSSLFACEYPYGISTRILGFADVTQGMTIVKGVNDTLNIVAGGVPYSIVLDQGNYKNEVEIVNELNAKFAAAGTGVTVLLYDHMAPRSGKMLIFERNGLAPDTLKLISGSALNQLTLISVSPEVKHAASPYQVVGSADLAEGLVIDYGVNDTLRFSVDGKEKTIKLKSGTYTSDKLLDEINEHLSKAATGVHAAYVGSRLSFIHDQPGAGHRIDSFAGNAALPLLGKVPKTEVTEPEQTIVPIFAVVEKETEHLLANRNKLTLQIAANQGQVLQFSIRQMDTDSLRISNITSLTREDASNAISRIDAAKAKVTSERAKLGALQNRLEHASNHLTNYEVNLTAAESGVRDADMAKEMMEITKQNVLQQAAQAMVAQANQLPQGVLNLLR